MSGYTGSRMERDENSGFMQPNSQYALTGFTGEQKQRVVEYLEKSYNVMAAMEYAGINRATFYYAKKFDKEFHAAVEKAREKHLDSIESGLFDTAKKPNGITAAIFLLKNWRRERYGERNIVEYHGKPRPVSYVSSLEVEGEVLIDEASVPPQITEQKP